jgi:uncharacterized protein (TIGR02678 family)
MRDLQSTIQLQGISVEQFLGYKQLLIDYLERFLGDLVLATNEISRKILLLEQAGIREQFLPVARRALADSLTRTPETEAQEAERWEGRWHGLRRWLLAWGVIKRVQGEEERFIKDAETDALYNVNRPVLARLLAANRPPSLVKAQEFFDRLRALAEDDITAHSDEARHRRLRLRLFRQLLDDPVLYYEELTDDEREYLDRQRGFILPEIETATGLVREVRAEGIAMADLTGSLSDYGLPEEGTEGHLTLLLATFLAGRLRDSSRVSITFDALVARTQGFIAEHHRHWRKDVREPGQDRVLTRTVTERLCALGLARREGDLIFPLPAIGRYALRKEK